MADPTQIGTAVGAGLATLLAGLSVLDARRSRRAAREYQPREFDEAREQAKSAESIASLAQAEAAAALRGLADLQAKLEASERARHKETQRHADQAREILGKIADVRERLAGCVTQEEAGSYNRQHVEEIRRLTSEVGRLTGAVQRWQPPTS